MRAAKSASKLRSPLLLSAQKPSSHRCKSNSKDARLLMQSWRGSFAACLVDNLWTTLWIAYG
jgi:hypothetical protein